MIGTEEIECDNRPDSVKIQLPANGVCAFRLEEAEKMEDLTDEMQEAIEEELENSGTEEDGRLRRGIRPLHAISSKVSSTVGQLIKKTKQ